MDELEAGAGLCRATSLLSVRPTRAVVELGALGDVMHAVLNAAHHANRHGPGDDRIAVALPGLHVLRGRARPGQEVVLFGTEEALARFAVLDGVETLRRRGMVAPLEMFPVYAEPREGGTAFVRDRSVARRSPGALRRAAARAVRRGGEPREAGDAQEADRSVLVLHYGSAVVHVRALEARVTGEPLLVSTYGFSSTRSPAVLPVGLALPLLDAA
jgi:hypothetical protein